MREVQRGIAFSKDESVKATLSFNDGEVTAKHLQGKLRGELRPPVCHLDEVFVGGHGDQSLGSATPGKLLECDGIAEMVCERYKVVDSTQHAADDSTR